MDVSSLEEFVLDAAKCSKLSTEQKRQLVYEVAKHSDSALDILHAWSRHEILQILCSELGKERKYTGFTKSKIIELLLKLVLEKQSQEQGNKQDPKRHTTSSSPCNNDPVVSTVCCKNSACKAKTSSEDLFCKRCSCCICHRYDDNKDPSLWLSCGSDPPFCGAPCGVSCHLECALRHENSGISRGLEGSFCCVSCGKLNDLLGCWGKQIVEARDTRRVDILCYRLSLAQKMLSGAKNFKNLCEVVDEAVSKLEQEVGPLTGLPVKKARGIVNRLSSGPEIQKMCASAIDSLDSLLLERISVIPSDHVRFEDVSSSSVNVVLNSSNSCLKNIVSYTLWHRKAEDTHYPPESTCRLIPPETKFQLNGLNSDTEYFIKIVSHGADNREMGIFERKFATEKKSRGHILLNLNSSENLAIERSQSPVTNCSVLSSNPSSVEDEANNHRGNDNQNLKESEDVISLLDDSANNLVNKHKDSSNVVLEETTSTDENGSNIPVPAKRLEADLLQIAPRNKGKGVDVVSDELRIGSSSKKGRAGDDFNAKGDGDLEKYVKVIRGLERDGHVEASFRQKFLTWYSLRATQQEIRVVRVFMEAFLDDPESLAEQLVDTFAYVVSSKRCCTVKSGFCTKLWH